MFSMVRKWFARNDDDARIKIGAHQLYLKLNNKHEIAYFEKFRAGVADVDVAIAQRLLKRGDVALDLGANIGYVSLHLLRLGALEVHAFEPNPVIFDRLKRCRASKLHCYPYAIAEKSGDRELILSISHHQGSTLYSEVVKIRPSVYGDKPVTVRVNVRSIDELFPETHFDYIKVDIEGGELDFIKGAHALLSTRPPRVLVLEIKPEFRQEYLHRLVRYFSFVWRVDYNRKTGDIRFVDVDASIEGDYRNQPPNFVFANDRSILG